MLFISHFSWTTLSRWTGFPLTMRKRSTSCRKTTESCSQTSCPALACWDVWQLTTVSLCSQGKHTAAYQLDLVWPLSDYRSGDCFFIWLVFCILLVFFKCCTACVSIFIFPFWPVCSLLEDRVTRLHGQLQRTQQHLMASSDLGSVDRKVLDDLYEDIHWLILVSGQQQDRNITKNRLTHTAFVCGYTVSPLLSEPAVTVNPALLHYLTVVVSESRE